MLKLTAGTAFYKRKLWVDNLGVNHFGEGMEYTCVYVISLPSYKKHFVSPVCLSEGHMICCCRDQ